MDLLCPKCREPWDNDSLHEEVKERIDAKESADYKKVYREFVQKGCEALGAAHNSETLGDIDPVLAEIYTVAGDDVDFAASMIQEAWNL